MFAGHIGAGLVMGRADRRINVGVLILAALLLDLLLWLFILLGWESASIPADFASSHQPHFTFPYSHGLVGSLAWSLLAALAAYWWFPRPGATKLRLAALVGAAVFSHWLLDALVHAPELAARGPSIEDGWLGVVAQHTVGADGGESGRRRRPMVVSAARADIAREKARGVRSGRGGPWVHRVRHDGRAAAALGRRHGRRFADHGVDCGRFGVVVGEGAWRAGLPIRRTFSPLT